MSAYLLGTTGFLLYFIYDINSIRWKYRMLQKFFAAGSLCVAASAIWTVAPLLAGNENHPAALIFWGAASAVFLILLIYTLFFALPFEATYLEENRERAAYTEGVYSLCRHPGVLWFAGLYLCLWAMSANFPAGFYFLSMIFWNYLYIVFQDVWVFPNTFSNYKEYQRNTPFLIPNIQSIRACLAHKKKS